MYAPLRFEFSHKQNNHGYRIQSITLDDGALVDVEDHQATQAADYFVSLGYEACINMNNQYDILSPRYRYH